MSRPLLAVGAKGPYVIEVKKLLNERVKPSWRLGGESDLAINDNFDQKTKTFVKYFQDEMFLDKDGMVGALTWAALYYDEDFNAYDIPQYVQQTTDKCWAAATAMLIGLNSPINKTGPSSGVLYETKPDGTTGGIDNSHTNMQKFANVLGLRMISDLHMTCYDLSYLVLTFGRVMLDIRGVSGSMTSATQNDSHFVLLAGLRGTGTPGGTTLLIYNPSYDAHSRRIIASFQYLKYKYPGLTYQCFYRLNNSSQIVM